MQRLTTAEFIEKARLVHGDFFDYSVVRYLKASLKVEIGCPLHGVFLQRPNDHLTGNKCPVCKFDKIATLKRGNKEAFVFKAQLAHGDTYDYSHVDYVNATTKIHIQCKLHGTFYQTPDKHAALGGTGCPQCSKGTSRGERLVEQVLTSWGVGYEREKRFDGLIGSTSNSRLRYDFWIPSQETLIEFDGEQHVQPVRTKGRISMEEATRKYLACVVNDTKKNNYALARGYELIRIPARYSSPSLQNEMESQYLSHILQRHRQSDCQNQGDYVS